MCRTGDKCGKNVEQAELSHVGQWEREWIQPLWKTAWHCLLKLKLGIQCSPAILLTSIYQHKNGCISTHTRIFIAIIPIITTGCDFSMPSFGHMMYPHPHPLTIPLISENTGSLPTACLSALSPVFSLISWSLVLTYFLPCVQHLPSTPGSWWVLPRGHQGM